MILMYVIQNKQVEVEVAYQNVRTQYLSDILDKFNINNETIISILLKSFNENVVKAMSFFLYHAFYVRNNYMQNVINV